MLIIDAIKYRLWTPKDEEKEFHPMIKEHYKEIFGENSIYFDVKHKLMSKSGIGSIPDAYVISVSKPYQWYVVENELASHPIYDHIVRQLTKFINGIKSQSTRNQILDTFYDEIRSDKLLRAYVEKAIGSQEIYHFLSRLLSNPPQIVIVIDQKTEEVKEACQVLRYQTSIVEFKTFLREDAENVHAHLFRPLYAIEEIPEKGKKERERRPLPEHYKSWKKMLQWVDESTQSLVEGLSTTIRNTLVNVNEVTHGRYYCFYKGKPSTKSIFAALLLTKKYLKVRIRTDPRTLRDPERLLKEKIYKGWFFKQGQEREFNLTDEDQIDYAMELIIRSYALAK
jgi:predicted transport protein